MNAGLEVQKQRTQVGYPGPPVLPEMVGEKAHQHGPRPKVGVAGGLERAHGGVDQGIACHAVLPGGNEVLIMTSWLRRIASVDVLKFHPALHFKLLDEVTVPVEP